MHNYMKGDIYIDLDYGAWYDVEDAVVAGTRDNNTMIFVQASSNTVYAGAGDDKITLSSGSNNNIIYAEAGDDFIGARFAKNSTIYGGKGKDTIRTMADKTYMDGGEDNDTLIPLNSVTGVTMNGGAGDDTFWFIESATVTATGGLGKDVYHFDPYYLFGPYHNDVVITDISSEDVIRMGNDVSEADGSELVISKNGDDIILKDSESGLGTFNVTLKGAAEDLEEVSKVTYRSVGITATLGEIFPDFFDDEEDDDDEDGAVSINAAGTAVKILEDFSEDEFYAADYSRKIVTVDGSAAGSKIEIYGNSLANKIIGSNYKDTLHGGSGKDSLNGGKGNDRIFGDAGNDTLNGGKGNDTLTGGNGKDFFVYAKSTGKDVITDYKAGQDKIKITGSYSYKIKGKDVVFTVGSGTLTVKNGKGKKITVNGKTKTYSKNLSSNISSVWFAEENNFVTNDNLSSITKNNLTPTSLEKIETNNFENLTTENSFVTFSEK